MTDHYSTLGVQRGASADDIKKAYRKMASQHHPDKGGDTEKFQQVEEAYRTLSDDNARSQYDNPQQGGQYHFHPGSGANPFEDIFRHFGQGHPFGDIFGGGRPVRNRTVNIQTAISLEDAYHGKDLLANVTLPNGQDRMINVKIPPGIQHNTTLRLAGMGEDTIPNIPRGDIHLTIFINDHSVFRRDGDDLISDLTIPVWYAILGEKVNVKTIDGRDLELTINPGTQFDQVLAVQGAGMPSMNDERFKGRLLVKLKITIPNNLTDKQKTLIKNAINSN
jgi:DnaJ-class molecular chaperone